MRVAHALATIKRHAAVVNLRLGVPGLDAELVDAIGDAARRIEAGELDDSFPVDVYQTGSGTSTNMNVNEVIATLASQALGRPVHPNDHVNASQSSNDVVPAAIRLAVITELAQHTHPCLERLVDELRKLSDRTMGAVKAGRTHLMDATPVTIGQEADAWAGLLERALARSVADLVALGELPLGGTAVGTGINAPDGFAGEVIASLAAETEFDLRTTANPMVHQGGQGALAEASSGLRGVAVALTKIANDIRLLASGPAAGLGELLLPELQAGSSIMPGKVNPVLCESVNQVAARVMGNDVTVGYAASQGILELNTYLPVIADALLESATLLANVAATVRRAVRRRHRGRRGAHPRLRRADLGAGDGAQPADRLRAGGGDRQAGAGERAFDHRRRRRRGRAAGRRGPPRPRPVACRRPRAASDAGSAAVAGEQLAQLFRKLASSS